MSQKNGEELNLQQIVLNINKQTKKDSQSKPWIIVFQGVDEEIKQHLLSSQFGFFLNEELTQSLTITEKDFEKGFINTNSNNITYFDNTKKQYEVWRADGNANIYIYLENLGFSIDNVDNEKEAEPAANFIVKLFEDDFNNNERRYRPLFRLCDQFNIAINRILETEEINKRFSSKQKKILLKVKAYVNQKMLSRFVLPKLNEELRSCYSLIRKSRINGKIEYVNKLISIFDDFNKKEQGYNNKCSRELEKINYSSNTLQQIVEDTPNGLECCACQYIAPWE